MNEYAKSKLEWLRMVVAAAEKAQSVFAMIPGKDWTEETHWDLRAANAIRDEARAKLREFEREIALVENNQ